MPQPRPNPGQPMPQPKPNPNCVDNQQCAGLVRTKDFCNSRSFPDSVKQGLCPRSCGFC
ncbi:hypothetical protein ANCCAN_26876 [Ancylostoma caninum]|uniref:ShKT domain-containing protein n=1 Tax=Ancylostoma caninum TaxID=29170 RepID=A0A368F8Y4_ANCCA|nr:hypothetical protein ANCCAN_26876 [Ancylostoma caninum]